MSLSGSLSTMSLGDLLQWTAAGQKTGRFDFRQGGVVKELYIQNGSIVGAASNQPTELLGHFLVARGKLNEDQLRAALEARGRSEEFLGQILLRLGFIRPEELLPALAERTEEIVDSLFEWDDAEFHFEPGASPGPRVVLISLSVNQVLLRGVHRRDEMARIRAIFPHGRVVLDRTERSVPREITEHPLAARILGALDGRRTINDLTVMVHASPLPVLKFLCELTRLQLATIVSMEGPAHALETGEAPHAELTNLPSATRIGAAREHLAKGDPEAALALLARGQVAADPDSAAVLAAAEAAFLSKVQREELPRDAVPELAQPLGNLMREPLQPEEFFLLSRLDGRWSVADVVKVAPMREVETITVLRSLLRRGLIRARGPVRV